MRNTYSINITASPQFGSWLRNEKLSLSFTTYQTNRLFFVGTTNEAKIILHERLFDKPMGLWATGNQLYMSTRYQIWRFDNYLVMGESYQGCDRLYVPSVSYTTGNLNVHDVAIDQSSQILFVNTDFSCLAKIETGYSFVPVWQPPFISKLVAEDRCHLNGLAMVDGQPTYMTACSATDQAAGWRNCRQNGGILLHLPSHEIVSRNLAMPHSPRWYEGKLWLLNSGTGELGYMAGEQFQPIIFCPGFVRGLTFWRNYAIVGLSKLRSANFSGLPLEIELGKFSQQAQCGLLVVDLNSGVIVHWLHIDGVVEELFDIVILPGVCNPSAIGFQSEDIERLIVFPDSQGVIISKPTVMRPAVGIAAPIAGLPNQERLQQERQLETIHEPVKFQQVYHFNPENLLAYDSMTFPRLGKRWQTKLRRGELIGISASIGGNMVGLAIAELLPDLTAEMISLFVLPACRRRGIGTQLVRLLSKALKQQECVQISVLYKVTRSTTEALEPILKNLGWQSPKLAFLLMQTNREQIAQAPWLDKYPLDNRFTIFPWPELTITDRQVLEELDFSSQLSPLDDPQRMEPLNSLGLRYQDKLVGWIVTHRVTNNTIRYSTLFVAEKFQRKARGISLLAEAIQRQIDSSVENYTCAVAPEYSDFLKFVRRHLQPYLTGMSESRQAIIEM